MFKNMGGLMKQAKEMQSKMTEMQEGLSDVEMEGQAGGGMVKVTLNGKGEARNVKIDPASVDMEDLEMLEDLIVAAVNDAKSKVEEEVQKQTQEMMGGMNLPAGMKLPF